MRVTSVGTAGPLPHSWPFQHNCKQLRVRPQRRGSGRWWPGEFSVLLALFGAGAPDTAWVPEWVVPSLVPLCHPGRPDGCHRALGSLQGQDVPPGGSKAFVMAGLWPWRWRWEWGARELQPSMWDLTQGARKPRSQRAGVGSDSGLGISSPNRPTHSPGSHCGLPWSPTLPRRGRGRPGADSSLATAHTPAGVYLLVTDVLKG